MHAAPALDGRDRPKVERVCRYLGRPPVAQERLSELPDGRLRYEMKKAWRDGTVALDFEPLDRIARLCAMVPPPGFHMVRHHANSSSTRTTTTSASSANRRHGSYAMCFSRTSPSAPSVRGRCGGSRLPPSPTTSPAFSLATTSATRQHQGLAPRPLASSRCHSRPEPPPHRSQQFVAHRRRLHTGAPIRQVRRAHCTAGPATCPPRAWHAVPPCSRRPTSGRRKASQTPIFPVRLSSPRQRRAPR
ncbi:MAG: transposase [Deltaproteobacteria bacterium]|nr:transposase [Deltaproteobacteria bacterium]